MSGVGVTLEAAGTFRCLYAWHLLEVVWLNSIILRNSWEVETTKAVSIETLGMFSLRSEDVGA